ncbi:hypothetical protein GOBAR_DD04458 [Gossypium barbadense]|nr:hypothetical protein GOBAR_DD04458 [Gossypium barbadense]
MPQLSSQQCTAALSHNSRILAAWFQSCCRLLHDPAQWTVKRALNESDMRRDEGGASICVWIQVETIIFIGPAFVTFNNVFIILGSIYNINLVNGS